MAHSGEPCYSGKLSGKLQEWGFVINPYDWCVANKIVDRKQHTILWQVNDLKILHVDHKVVSSFIGQLDKTFGQKAPLTKMQGLVYNYLGMTISYSTPKKVRILMIDCIQDMLHKLPAGMEGRPQLEQPITCLKPTIQTQSCRKSRHQSYSITMWLSFSSFVRELDPAYKKLLLFFAPG
jgi:hypothetical protein